MRRLLLIVACAVIWSASNNRTFIEPDISLTPCPSLLRERKKPFVFQASTNWRTPRADTNLSGVTCLLIPWQSQYGEPSVLSATEINEIYVHSPERFCT